jgi:hypothetical protein
MTVHYELNGQSFTALKPPPRVQVQRGSLIADRVRDTGGQQELDYYWERLSEGGDLQAQRSFAGEPQPMGNR